MAESDKELYAAEVVKADCERIRQAHWAALCELQPEVVKCSSYKDFCAWAQRVNKLAEQIMRRPN